ncbi:2-keto-myo-inositol isomerase [Paracoccus halophilus]|uniref:2-keto-myo-inositol isomerase n=1 Tax=Paracoccus halophilus TaxID=376733 RepID=A0A099F8M4_9RHOB|nr:TIM barrel protein [Paracoccus halophilus]KGJ06457.1 xylose isomerase [Paracoccus halophilus]SFA38201.1 2-keto-myo-inositol isomerase [Paracoccus halophilus]
MRFAINHIAAPKLALGEFFAMCGRLGVTEVEIRNDLPDIVGTMDPRSVHALAAEHGITILSINALYPFNLWSGDLPDRAQRLADYAAECGAMAVVMCPLNDGSKVAHSQVVAALDAMKPILRERGLTGLVEPLGFPISSLRTKAEAIAAITEAGDDGTYRLLHDTFHHHLAGETEIYPNRTGLVHVSGVSDPGVAVADMLDGHRMLVDGADRLENVAQIRALLAGGYAGPFSHEPFAQEVHDLADPETALRSSMDHMRGAVS